MSMRPSIRKAVIFTSSAVAILYLVYRGVFTLNLNTSYAVFASLFLYIGELYGVMNMLLYFVQVWDAYEPPQKPLLEGVRTVDIFVPTYNEDPDLLRMTLQACLRLDYPHKRIFLCDDGKRPAAEALAKDLGVTYMIRPDNRHAKAGNLNHAFAKTDGEFIIIFDADHVPDPNFITRLIGYFEDEKMGFVQTPHGFYNFESFQARLNHAKGSYWEEGQLFYHVIQPGRNHWNAPIFAGSAAMFRRKALEEVGFIAVETITEDMHTGLRMHSKGWKSLGISVRMITGQAAQDVTTFHTQRLRWGEGNLSVLAYDNPLTMPGLNWGQRLCYFGTMINWCGGVFKLPIYLTPLLMLYTGVPPVREFTWTLAILMSFYMLCSIFGVKYISNGYGSVWYSELFTMASFWTQVRGTMRAIFWRKFQQFIVTKKRGRQAKSIWPFVRPQLILIFISVLALVWAWSRVILGISDDVFKPVLASFWALFHMLLAYLVVRRALWPDDRRYTTRHIVHLPIAYEVAADAPSGPRRGYGVTADLNDMGVGFVAYERLPEGAPLRLTLYGGGDEIECIGSIKSWRPLTPKSAEPAGGATGYHYGIAFDEPSAVQKDSLNHLCLHYAVPRLYAFYEQEHQRMDDVIKAQLANLFLHRRSTRRRDFHLPVFVALKEGGPILPAVTEDISSKAMAVMAEEEVAPGTECPFMLTTPLGEVKGMSRVLRSVPRQYAARRFYLCVLEFAEFEGGGRIILDALLDKSAGKRLHDILTPTRLPMPVPVNRPLATGMAAAAIFIFAELGLFRWVYNDDFFLQGVAYADRQISPEDSANIDRIYAATMRETYPSTDRLVLLGHSLQRMDRTAELAEVTKVLGPRDRNNLGLQLALAFAYDQREDYDQADIEYRRLFAALDAGKIPEARREELMAGAARCSVHAGRQELAGERYRQLLERFPDRPAYRNEFAGILLDGGRLDEAAELYQGHNPDYEGRVLLVMIYTSAKNSAAAEREARALLKDNPGDATAEGLLADVLNLRGDFRQARSIYERLLKSNASDLKLAVQLAHTSLWAKNYQEALERFQALADQGILENPEALRKFPDLPRAYVNAAANAPDVKAVGLQTILQLTDHALAEKTNDAAFLAQLGYVLHRLEEFDQSSAVLQRALELDPNDASTRRQLAGVLVALGKPDDALKLLQGRENSLDAHIMMVDVYAAAKDYASAERECRELLKGRPTDQELRFRLANILSWNKQYPQALEAFAELVKADPKNPEYAVRQAETTLWSGDCKGALEMYQVQLTADFDRPALWWGFVDAAAGATAMTEGQVSVAVAVADKTIKGEHKSARVVEIFRKQGKEMTEVSYLTRLGWVLQHHAKDADRAGEVLNLALALQPREPGVRKELAGVLAAAARYADALRMYEGLQLEWQDRLPLARIYAAAEDFTGATEQCRLALDKQPLDKDAQRLLADVLSWKGDYPPSLEQFARLVKAFPDDKDIRRRQAEVTLWSGNALRALELYQAALVDGGDQQLLSTGFMEAAGRLDQLTPQQSVRAKEIAAVVARSGDRATTADPANVERIARTAWVLYHHLNDKKGAQTLALQAAALPTDDPAALTRLGWILHEMGDKEESQKVLDKAVALKPRVASVRKELAGVLTAVQRFPEARALLEGLAKDYPKNIALQGDLARVSLWAGNPAEALARLQTILETDFQQPELWRSYADAASVVPELNPKQTDLALRIADQPTPRVSKPEDAVFLSRLGWALYREGERTKTPTLRSRAGVLLDRAVALQPKDAKAREEIAGVLVAAGRSKQALPWLEELAQARPGDAELQARLAQVALWGGDPVGALNRLEHLLAANDAPSPLWAVYADAAAAAAKGVMTTQQIDRVVKLADSAPPETAPDKTLYQSRLAWVLYREGRKDKADVLLEKVLAAAPVVARSPDRATTAARREIAGVLTAAGRFKEALAWLNELAISDPTDVVLQGQLAQTTLWSGDPKGALPRLRVALTANFDQPELWASTIDAAAGATKGTLTRAEVQLLLRIAERPVPATAPDKAIYLSRLAWVLYREEEQARAGELLDQATALNPKDPKTRRELAGVLTAVGKNEAGIRLYEGLTLDLEDRFQMVVLYCAARRFAEAEKHCRAILLEKPKEPRARRWLADVLLWSNQYAAALGQYQQLLVADFEQPALWPSYVEAASRADALTEDQTRLALEIIDQDEDDDQDSVYLARIALLLHRHVEQKKALPRLAGQTVGLLASPLAPGALLTTVATVAESERPTQSRTLLARAVAARPQQNPTALARLAFMAHQMSRTVEATKLLDEAIALRPEEPAVRRELGDSLVAMGRLEAALPWFEELAAANPKDAELQVRLAQVTVWSGAYAKGLDRMGKVLKADFQQPILWPTYVDAASGAPSMTETQMELALRIAAQPIPFKDEVAQSLFVTRLAWVFIRESEHAKGDGWQNDANKLLNQALKLAARDLKARRELAGVLGAARRFKEALTLYEELAEAYPSDRELRVHVAEMSLWSGAYAKAVARYEDLLQANFDQPTLWRGYVDSASGAPSLTATQTQLVLRVAGQAPIFKDGDDEAAYLSRLAWALVRETDKDKADDEKQAKAAILLARAVALKPQDPKVRRELAGVLAAAGQSDAGLAMYEGLTLTAEDRLQLISLYAAAKRFPEAQAQCLALLKEKPNDHEGRIMLARTTLWAGDSAAALEQMQTLLAEDFEQPDLWTSFVDAASAAQEMKPAQLALALRIAERPIKTQRTPVVFLSRLAWTLVREGKAAKDEKLLKRAAVLLEQAMALKPREPAERREVAGVLASLGDNKGALKLLAGLEAKGVADLALRVSLYAADKDFEAAEKAARQWVEQAPDDFEARFQLANVLSWNKQYDEAAPMFQQLAETKPDDPRLPPRLAEIALWSGQYDLALDRYYLLLKPNWRQPDLWQGYIDAASATKQLPAEPHKAMLLQIYEKMLETPSEDAAFLGRFAWTLRRVDEPKKSVALLKRVVEIDPKSREMRRQLADALSAAEMYAEAEKQYQILLRSAPESP
jgi:tetratricopeptide (TPR) repeat protein/cellulose synthase/poly-beta-1,6-N-acetylglucosamine synthase-like glycosyltransferase